MDSRNASARPVNVFVHICKHAERMPLVMRSFQCGIGQRKALLHFQVKPVEMPLCLSLCANASAGLLDPAFRGLSCGCVSERAWPQLQHVNLLPFADGKHDLLFAHADLWVNALAIAAMPWFRRGDTAVTPASGMHSGGQLPAIAGSGRRCVPAATMDACVKEEIDLGAVWTRNAGTAPVAGASPGSFYWRNRTRTTYRCPDATGKLDSPWDWWMDAHLRCRTAALSRGVAECCYGWSDFVYLPRRAHAAFTELAAAFRAVFHEVALPTILNELRNRSGGVKWDTSSLRCAGGCCVNLPWNRETLNAPCGHKVLLQHLPRLSPWREGSCESPASDARLESQSHRGTVPPWLRLKAPYG